MKIFTKFVLACGVLATAFVPGLRAVAFADSITYNVQATLQYGGTLTGTFMESGGLITSYNLTASAGPGAPGFTFTGFDFTNADSTITSNDVNKVFRVDAGAGAEELDIIFSQTLNGTAVTFSGSSYESEITAGNRTITSGSATPMVAATPEPSALMLLGTGLLAIAAVLFLKRKRLGEAFVTA